MKVAAAEADIERSEETPTWLTTAEAAAKLRKTPETLANWVGAQRVPVHAWRPLPKGYLFLASWVADPVFITAHARGNDSEMTANGIN